jgi:hypothetical protein
MVFSAFPATNPTNSVFCGSTRIGGAPFRCEGEPHTHVLGGMFCIYRIYRFLCSENQASVWQG